MREDERKPSRVKAFFRRVKGKIKRNRTWRCLDKEWCELEFSNKLVVIICFVLFLELLMAVFWYPQGDWSVVSSTFRSVFGGIMGYIIGGMGAAEDTSKVVDALDTSLKEKSLQAKSCDLDSDECEVESLTLPGTTFIRTAIAGFICLTCIVALFVAIILDSGVYQEGLVRVMDLISTTIGFLISNASRKK